MKNFFKSGLLTLLLGQAAVAQITINRSNLGNLVGRTYIGVNTETNVENISIGNAGPNQTWNFSMLVNESEDTIPFVNPTSLPCAPDFPTSNLGLAQGGGASFLVDNNAFIDIVGFCDVDDVNGNSLVKYTGSERIISFPLSYNNSFTGQSQYKSKEVSDFPGADSLIYTSINNYNYVIDGWGTITTPEGTFPCLRKKQTNVYTDSIEILANGSWLKDNEPSVDTLIFYEFYSQNSLFIANFSQDLSGVTTSATYFKSGTVGVQPIGKNNNAFHVYPNPSKGKFTFRAEKTGLKTIQISNQLGVEIGNYTLEEGTRDIDLSAFPSGIYHLKAGDGVQLWSEKLVLE